MGCMCEVARTPCTAKWCLVLLGTKAFDTDWDASLQVDSNVVRDFLMALFAAEDAKRWAAPRLFGCLQSTIEASFQLLYHAGLCRTNTTSRFSTWKVLNYNVHLRMSLLSISAYYSSSSRLYVRQLSINPLPSNYHIQL